MFMYDGGRSIVLYGLRGKKREGGWERERKRERERERDGLLYVCSSPMVVLDGVIVRISSCMFV